MRIEPCSPSHPQVRRLLDLHLAGMRDTSPPEFSFALDHSGLEAPDIAMFGLWDCDDLLAIGAIRELSAQAGEVKSMRTDPPALRRGAGQRMLDHLIALARERGYRRLSLETGTGPDFAAAEALYLKAGFRPGEAFGDYAPSDFNRFFHLDL